MKEGKEFYEALERGDGLGAHYLFVPEPVIPSCIREMRERSEENFNRYKAEQEYLDKLPKEFHKDELMYRLKKCKR